MEGAGRTSREGWRFEWVKRRMKRKVSGGPEGPGEAGMVKGMVRQGRRLGEKEGDRNTTEMPATQLDISACGGGVGSSVKK